MRVKLSPHKVVDLRQDACGLWYEIGAFAFVVDTVAQ